MKLRAMVMSLALLLPAVGALAAKQTLVGTDTLPQATVKINANFSELYTADGNLQPLDADLTAIAAITAANDDFIQRKAAAWVARSIAQVKSDLGVDQVDNTSDAAKPVSTATQTALNAKAALASPALTGTPTAPTAAAGTNTTQIATTAGIVAERTATATLTGKSISGGQITSAVATSTALAANGANCTAGSVAAGVDASGVAEGCTALATSATTDTTNASNISSGTLAAGRLPAHTGDVTSSVGSAALTVAAGAVTDDKSALAVKPACTAVATTNQTLSGLPTLDGTALADGSIALLTAQTAGQENGPWITHAGAWTRPSWYASGSTVQAFRFITTLVRTGTLYQGSTWRQTASAPITIDTTATVWSITPLALNATTTTGLPVGANPTASSGASAVNGSAATFMRSDAAPPIDLTAAYTWTGATTTYSSAEPRILLNETDQATDQKLWDLDVQSAILRGRTRTDADGTGQSWLIVTRGSGNAISNISLGNTTNNPTFSLLGTGALSLGGGAISTGGQISSSNNQMAARGFALSGSTFAPTGAGISGSNVLNFYTGGTSRGGFDLSGNFGTSQATADQSVAVSVVTTGFTATIANNISTQLYNPAGTLASGTTTMPATPINGQLLRISSSQTITAWTLSPNSGQTLNNAPTTLAAGLGVSYIYVLASTTWYRLQ